MQQKDLKECFFSPSLLFFFFWRGVSYSMQREDQGMGQEVDQSHSLTV